MEVIVHFHSFFNLKDLECIIQWTGPPWHTPIR